MSYTPNNISAIRAAGDLDPAHNLDDAEYVIGHPDDYDAETVKAATELVDRHYA